MRQTNRQAHEAQMSLFAAQLPSGANLTGSIFVQMLDTPRRAVPPRNIEGASKAFWRPFSTTAISKPVQCRSAAQHAKRIC